jgi:hypothetical protein
LKVRACVAAAAAAVGLALCPPARGAGPAAAAALGSCHACHIGLGGELAAPAEAFRDDAHAQPGLGCTACHGGDSTADDAGAAMDPAKGFRGSPERRSIPRLCGRCHADAAFVKRYAPSLPTDQLAQYETSVHAKELARGNQRAAVCTSCHGAHGILSPRDPRSPVYPTRVVGTCAKCHAGPGASNPVAAYRRSVHAAALAGGDLSAPTCPRCHGSHGATPPGVESVANVCGQCHPQNMELYRASPHEPAFAAMDLGACEACHGNHDIARPTDAFVGLGQGAVCAKCHAADDPGGEAAARIHAALAGAARLLEEAQRRTEAARSRGALMVDAQVAIEDGRQQLIHARTLVHAADLQKVEPKTQAAATASRKALDDARRAFAEIRYRRAGLLVALALIVVAIVALVMKVRQVDAQRR